MNPPSLSAKDLFDFAVSLRHKELLPLLSNSSFGHLRFKFSEENNWLRLDQLFVTVVKKDAKPSELVQRLTIALADWAPGPHQLLMTKMRGELGERGVRAEADVLANHSLQAGWLHQLMTDNDVSMVMSQSIERHWEALGVGLQEEVKLYAGELFSYFRGKEKTDVFSKYLENEVDEHLRLAHLNHYYSTKPIDRDHLTTGQIFEFEIDVGGVINKEYWICLSPACDMVPGQKKHGWKVRLGDAMPFIAVQLHPVKDLKDALKNINQNRYIFLTNHEKLFPLQFTLDSKISSNPIWEQMFALGFGKLISDGTEKSLPIVTLQRIGSPPEATPGDGEQNDALSEQEQSGLQITTRDARIVCQLRYEYALNLLQKLGSSLSRVGLDFRGL